MPETASGRANGLASIWKSSGPRPVVCEDDRDVGGGAVPVAESEKPVSSWLALVPVRRGAGRSPAAMSRS